MEAIVTSTYQPHNDLEEIRVKEGEREIRVLAGCNKTGIEFFYYRISKWHYPFDADPLTEEDRARLAAAIYDHFTARGRGVEIDRRRFSPDVMKSWMARSSKIGRVRRAAFAGEKLIGLATS